jgi:hypothetical protein
MALSAGHDFSIANTPMPLWTRCQPIDPGWLYIIQAGDLLKIGKTRQPQRRLAAAKTWLPEADVIGIKPFWYIDQFERTLLCGIANFWLEGEWHRFPDETWSDFLTDGFRMFNDHNRNKNTVDFSYWIGGSGMGELIMEQNRRRVSLRNWQQSASAGL